MANVIFQSTLGSEFARETSYISPTSREITIQRFDTFLVTEGFELESQYPMMNLGEGSGVYVTDAVSGANIYRQYRGYNGNDPALVEQYGTDSIVYLNDGSNVVTYNAATNSWVTQTITVPRDTILRIEYRSNYTVTANAYKVYGYVSVVNNILPLKPYSITDVIVRCCDLLEPLQYGQKPRFRLDGVVYDNTTGRATSYRAGSQAAKFDKIRAPEFSFTKATFREIMTQIGGKIHGEMRILNSTLGSDGRFYFTFGFDMYGSQEVSPIKDRLKVSTMSGTDINDYHTSLDSSVNNLINVLDFAQGVTMEPIAGHSITLRSETTTARMEESNSTVIPTQYPVYQFPQENAIIVTKIPTGGTSLNPTYKSGSWDITPYLFEATDYNNLNSYTELYPQSKAYAIYYTQGQQGIRGLFFKVPTIISYDIKTYSIVNILRAVTGDGSLVIPAELYPLLQFQVNYIPIYSDRILTPKALSIGGLPRTLAYNQGENGIEARYFGEHLKGVSARLGNVEKSETYLLAWLSDIPKIGTKYDDNYYISAVSCEFKPTHIVCAVGLSKNYNRLSNYIGINSVKRMWEISERQIIERDTVWKRYCLITVSDRMTAEERAVPDNERWSDFISPTFVYFNRGAIDYHNVCAMFKGYNIDGQEIQTYPVSLPVIGSAIGNVISLTFKFKDNYAAGDKSVYYDSTANDGVQGFFGQGVPYADYYGRIYYADVRIGVNNNANAEMPMTLPQDTAANNSDFPARTGYCSTDKFTYRKDGRERTSISINYETVTTDERIIIGSGLAKNARVVNGFAGYNSTAFDNLDLIYFTKTLGALDEYEPEDADKLVMSNTAAFAWTSVFPNNKGAELHLPVAPGGALVYKSWAICTKITTTTERYAGEDGTETEVTVTKGGEILIGGNWAPNGETVYFTEKQSIEDCYGVAEADVWQ